jgi:hypothetical protein
MTNMERAARIAAYGQGHELLTHSLQKFPRHMWQFRAEADAWSIHEIIIHITDSEANSYIRCRRLLAEPGETLMAYDEKRWARELNYHDQSPEEALELFRWLRLRSYDLIRHAPEEVWERKCYHPENGPMSLDDWLETYQRHVPEHLAQMEHVFEHWQRRLRDGTP